MALRPPVARGLRFRGCCLARPINQTRSSNCAHCFHGGYCENGGARAWSRTFCVAQTAAQMLFSRQHPRRGRRGSHGDGTPRSAVRAIGAPTLFYFAVRGLRGSAADGVACCLSSLSCFRCRPSRSCLVRQTPEQTATTNPARAQSAQDQGQSLSLLQTVQRAVSVGRIYLSRTRHLGYVVAVSHSDFREGAPSDPSKARCPR
jgi:hypothetical protein